jgi:hypothetical protein
VAEHDAPNNAEHECGVTEDIWCNGLETIGLRSNTVGLNADLGH